MAPVAIVGVGLRLPGGIVDLDTFADRLWAKVDAVGKVPAERWTDDAIPDPDITKRMAHGAFLERLDLFDAAFFGIAPREAVSLDPQQRLLLEVTWEALEHACIAPKDIAGTPTGVFMGLAPSDYVRDLLRDPAQIEAYAPSGTAYGTAVGRLSYFFDLLGPSIAIDTACSSSLVAIHAAAQSLRLGECNTALAGGVNVILAPEMSAGYAKARMLSPDGRCRSFSADARGYVRGEGCVVAVLRRLSDAQANGDRILGIIRGSAVNQDGRSQGLTAPRGSSQEAAIRAALAQAGVHPHEMGFVEAHGSGTPLGDPVEAEALGKTLCVGRAADEPLTIGSVKTNIGHLETAGGAAGLAKVLLAFERGSIPPNLHFAEPNPLIAWDDLRLRVAAEAIHWPRGRKPRCAGVNAFGFGGTNAHVVLEEPPHTAAMARPDVDVFILPVSARTPASLAASLRNYRDRLADDDLSVVCQAAALGRAHFAHRCAVVGATAAELRKRLSEVLARHGTGDTGAPSRPVVALRILGERGDESATLAALQIIAPAFTEGMAMDGALDSPPVLQNCRFALHFGLAKLLRRWGVAPTRLLAVRSDQAMAEAVQAALGSDPEIVFQDNQGAAPDQASVIVAASDGTRIWRGLLAAIAQLYEAGVPVDWTAIYAGYPPARATLPTYPFDRKRHWAPQVRAFRREPEAAEAVMERENTLERLLSVPAEERSRLALDLVRMVLRPFQGNPDDILPVKRPFREAGLDADSAPLRQKLEAAFGRALPATVLLNYPTLQDLTAYLLGRLEPPESAVPGSTPRRLSEEKLQQRLRLRLGKIKLTSILTFRADVTFAYDLPTLGNLPCRNFRSTLIFRSIKQNCSKKRWL